ncbi:MULTISPECIES: hypothetical protein [unclassified Moritella]|uniref:hypothetical protein n=1 Tax=unclassified Moritella TaxID=2637987 RepID=UPI001BA92A3E|nr:MULTISPECIES: hypothetical protein [unclassified Moritella]QUM82216.1 hypothetical protein HWV01_18990 [Moritella sp. 5]QUM86516.1 hypothetical protein HWV02_19390 [Moritella sp. 28]QUM90742.1 hypothetical protein HWV03_19065 [Moritella sp. 36]
MLGRKNARNRNAVLANAGIASVGATATSATSNAAALSANQNPPPSTKAQKALDRVKSLGPLAIDRRGDIAGWIGDSADGFNDLAKHIRDGESAYTGGGALEASASTILGPLMLVHDTLTNIYEWKTNFRNGTQLTANPRLSPADAILYSNTKTTAYFKKRMVKKICGDSVSFSGGMLSAVTHVNVLGATRHGRSDAKTIAHLVRLNKLLSQYKGKGQHLSEVCDLCKVIIDAKKLKLESQSAALVADLIPGSVAGGATAAVSFIHGQTMASRLSKMAFDIEETAQKLHHRAFYEMNASSSKVYEPETPALDMVRELFSQVGRIEKERVLINFSGHKLKLGGEHRRADKLMREPGGWLTIVDKLNLI